MEQKKKTSAQVFCSNDNEKGISNGNPLYLSILHLTKGKKSKWTKKVEREDDTC